MQVDKYLERTSARADYFTAFYFPASEQSARDILAAAELWLKPKVGDVDLHETGYLDSGDSRLANVVAPKGADCDYYFRLDESNEAGNWRSTLILHAAANGESWVSLRVSNDAGIRYRVPRLARTLLETVDGHNNGVLVRSEPLRIGSSEVESLLESICSFERTIPILVAGTDSNGDFEQFRRDLVKWSRETVGLAQVVLLDPVATRDLADTLGDLYSVPPWTIRTYKPDVDPSSAALAVRHKILGRNALTSRSRGSIERLLGLVAGASSEVATPDPSVERRVQRVLDAFLVNQARSTTTTSAKQVAERLQQHNQVAAALETAQQVEPKLDDAAQLALVRSILNIADINEGNLMAILEALTTPQASSSAALGEIERELTEARSELTASQENIALMKNVNKEMQLDIAVLEEVNQGLRDALSNLSRKADWMEAKLHELQVYQIESAAAKASAFDSYFRLATYDDLVDCLGGLSKFGIVYMGKIDDITDVQEADEVDIVPRRAARCLKLLAEYVRMRAAGEWNDGLLNFVEKTPAGIEGIPSEWFAPTETGVTKRQKDFMRERNYPVPLDVSPDGYVTMLMHFKVGNFGTVKPRMYIHDDVGRTGQVIIGYIGAHPTSASSRYI